MLVLTEQGAHAMKRYKDFARMSPPEVVRTFLPHPKDCCTDDEAPE